MGSFCTRCGRPLSEGEVCNCAAEQNVQRNESAQDNLNAQVNESENVQSDSNVVSASAPAAPRKQGYFKSVAKTFDAISRKPVVAGREFVEKGNAGIALFFILLQGLFVGLFAVVLSSRIAKVISTVADLLSYYGIGKTSTITRMKMPYLKDFIFTVVVSIILTLVLALLLTIANFIIRNKVSYKQMLCSVALRSIYIIYITIVSIVLLYVNIDAGLLCFYAANIIGIIIIVMTMPVESDNVNRVPLTMFFVFAAFLIISLLVMSRCWMVYVPGSIQTALSQLKDYFGNSSKSLKGMY
jgi:hypothetical protein